jgi:hypothetical protein
MDMEQRFPVLEAEFHLPSETINRANGLLSPQRGGDVGDEKRVLEDNKYDRLIPRPLRLVVLIADFCRCL